MEILNKIIEVHKRLIHVFDFLNEFKGINILKSIIRILLLIVFIIPFIVMQVMITIIYVFIFVTSIPSKLVKNVRENAVPYDENNKWLFNLSYLLLYFFVIPFDVFYIAFNTILVIFCFLSDCLIWILTLGKTKLEGTKISLSREVTQSSKVNNSDIICVIIYIILAVGIYIVTNYYTGNGVLYDNLIENAYSTTNHLIFNSIFTLILIIYYAIYFASCKKNQKIEIKENEEIK